MLRRAALAVDGQAGNGLGPAGAEDGHAADVARLHADAVDVAPVHVFRRVLGQRQQRRHATGNIGRMAVLGAGWPESVPGLTVDRQCGSSQQTISMAAASVISGQADVIAPAVVEMMTSVPLGPRTSRVPAIPPARPVSATPRARGARLQRPLQPGLSAPS
ncbi:hypothetical protein GS482_13140 [Rhodococcus hoagii]|nr:hypothetical protein [Prescottella equi]